MIDTETRPPRSAGWFWLIIRIAVSLVILIGLFLQLNARQIGEAMIHVGAGSVALMSVFIFAISVPMAQRWRLVIEANGNKLSFSDTWFSTLVGMFFNQILPTSIGGDVVRGIYAYRAGIPVDSAVKTVLVDRVVGLFALVVSVVPGLFFLFHQSGPTLILASIAAMIAIALVGFVVLCGMDRLAALLPQSIFASRHADWRGHLAGVVRTLIAISPLVRRLIVDRQCFIHIFALSVLAQGALFTVAIVFAHKLDGSIAVLHVLAVMPLAMLLSSIPISIAGWGVREGAMIGTMALVGVEAGQAVTVSILFGLVQLIASLPGGFIWWVFDRQLARRRENKILQPHNH